MKSSFDFTEAQFNGAFFDFSFSFADSPFVVSVICNKNDEGYISDWVISGIRRRDDKPRFLVRVQSGLSSAQDDIEATLIEEWHNSLKPLTFGSANQGGFDLEPSTLPKESSLHHASFHLFAHDRLGHFASTSETIAARTADMYLLVKSLGFVQAQKLVIEHEEIRALASVPASTTTNRLNTARKRGLIPLNKPKDVAFTTKSENY